MHRFSLLVEGSATFTLSKLAEVESEIIERLQNDSSSVHIRNLQSLALDKTIQAVGMFSIFEAALQRELDTKNGFAGLRNELKELEEEEALDRFEIFYWAINSLKHGVGASFDNLLKRKDDLPFTIKVDPDGFFNEGDCAEIDTLVLADDQFVLNCARLIHQISEILEAAGKATNL